jgi:hypothetical protein
MGSQHCETTELHGKPEEPREASEHQRLDPPRERLFEARETPDEPAVNERSEPTPTRTLRHGELQGHPRELPGDRDSK